MFSGFSWVALGPDALIMHIRFEFRNVYSLPASPNQSDRPHSSSVADESATTDASARTEDVDAAVGESDDDPVRVECDRCGNGRGWVGYGGLHCVVWEVVVRGKRNTSKKGTAVAPFIHWIGINVSAPPTSCYSRIMYDSLKCWRYENLRCGGSADCANWPCIAGEIGLGREAASS